MPSKLLFMPPNETAGQRVKRQMEAFLERHKTDSRAIEKRTGIAYTTIDRWLRVDAKTQPQLHKLEAVARAYGETLQEAFPLGENEEVEIDGRRYALSSLDGRPVDREHLKWMKHLTVEKADEIHKAKNKLKKK